MATALEDKRSSELDSGPERANDPAIGPVRVCFMIDRLRPAGTETQLLALIHQSDRRVVEPYLILLDGEDPVSRSLEPRCCPVLRLGIRSLARPRTLSKMWQLVGFLRRERIEVLQVYFKDSSYLGLSASWLAGVPERVRTQNNLGHWMKPWDRWLARWVSRIATVTLANCEACRDRAAVDTRAAVSDVAVVENGVDLERFASTPAGRTVDENGSYRVGAVANLREVKGLDLLVRAADQLSKTHTDLIFDVAGEGEYRSELEKLVQRSGLGARFRLPGSIADIPAFLGGLAVAVLSSLSEGMPNAVLEYMAAGRPIVATRVGAVPRLIEDGVHGLLVPPGDVDALAAAIEKLLDDRELAFRLGVAARERAEKEFSRSVMIRRFEKFFASLRDRSLGTRQS
jgi:glycosyltransferase involved in cell wall biosynthesis